MSLFLEVNYRDYLKKWMSRLPKRGHGELTRMAIAIGVHQTLMSLVLKGDRDLSPEQAFDLSQYLEHSDVETDYFMLLVQFGRAGNHRYKNALLSKIEKLRRESLVLSKRVQQNRTLTETQRNTIYSSWLYSAIRLFTSLGSAGVTAEDVQAKFHISRQRSVELLSYLVSTGLVSQVEDRYKMENVKTFLEQGSPHFLKHHANWRLRAIDRADNLSQKELMFTSPVSISLDDFDRLREELAEFIKKFLQTVHSSREEDIACLNIDFFWMTGESRTHLKTQQQSKR